MEEKLGVLGEIGFRNFGGKMGEKREMGGRQWVVVVQRGRRWCSGGGGNDGWRWNGGFVGVWEKKDGDGGGEVCSVRWKWGKEGVNSDLKAGHVRA
jgi:hypothetical protein